MKIYTCYTPSHKEMFDEYFMGSPSISEYEIIAEEFPQECATGAYLSDGWMNTMNRKLDLIIRAIDENMGEVFIHSDCDVQFLRPSKEYIESFFYKTDLDIILQSDIYMLCAGFFACKASNKTRLLFSLIKHNILMFEHDQLALNYFLKGWKEHITDINMNYRMFDSRIWNVGHTLYNRWEGQDFEVPQNILVHHANWTVGIENKTKLLKMVKDNTVF